MSSVHPVFSKRQRYRDKGQDHKYPSMDVASNTILTPRLKQQKPQGKVCTRKHPHLQLPAHTHRSNHGVEKAEVDPVFLRYNFRTRPLSLPAQQIDSITVKSDVLADFVRICSRLVRLLLQPRCNACTGLQYLVTSLWLEMGALEPLTGCDDCIRHDEIIRVMSRGADQGNCLPVCVYNIPNTRLQPSNKSYLIHITSW